MMTNPSRTTTGPGITATEEAALAAIDLSGLVDRLKEVIAIKSIPGTPGEVAVQHWYHQQFVDCGLTVDFWPIDLEAMSKHPDFPGVEVDRKEAWGLVGAWGGNDGPTLILNGHVDVVPAGELAQWDSEPFEARVEGENVYGRGTADMKAGLLAGLAAVRAIQAAGIRLKGKVLVQSVIGEEDGGLGTFSTIQRGHLGDAAVIMEPTDLTIVPACAGALTFRLHMSGHATHAGLRTEGVSVIEKFQLVWNAIQALETRRNLDPHPFMRDLALPYPINIGMLHAGQWASSVPDELIAEGRLGVALGETVDAARADLEQAIAAVSESDEWLRQNPITVDWFGGQFAPGQMPEGHPFLDLISNAHADLLGEVPAAHGVPWGSDLRLLSTIGGVPTLHYGPGSLRVCHAPNEFVPLSEVKATAETLALTILRFCGYHDER
ncbi:MAG: acetylornithine deacetylase [Actinomycetia bacterium]|nr:acetylornithine deacetylase [Actinomycetes bacterium]